MTTTGESFLINNSGQKIPRNFGSFYCNGAKIEVNICAEAAITSVL